MKTDKILIPDRSQFTYCQDGSNRKEGKNDKVTSSVDDHPDKEFNLSGFIKDGIEDYNRKSTYLHVSKVKEFIRLLKEKLDNASIGYFRNVPIIAVKNEIDKLAGERLNGN